MKLSYRDKVIFICAIVILILVAGFFLFIKPKYEEMNAAKSYLATKEEEKAGIEARINTLTGLVDQLKELAKTVDEEQDRFIVHQDPYLMEQFVYEILTECDLTVRNMNTKYITPDSAQEYVVPDKNVVSYELLMKGDLYDELPEEIRDKYNGVAARIGENVIIGITTMTIGYEDDLDYSNALKFLDTIAEDERTIRATSFSGNYEEKDNSEPTVTGEIPVQIYSIFPLNVEKVMEETDQVEIVPVETPAE
ncbi:MAG: hypothetical protein IJ007_07955 [Oscillospiraceae bacterium]|nr:hypothetical protein [Oscillospiraceae bacterium]